MPIEKILGPCRWLVGLYIREEKRREEKRGLRLAR
jgi:hypothetical protein